MTSETEQKATPTPASGQPAAGGMAVAHQEHGKTLTLQPIAPGFDSASVRCATECRLRELIWKDEDLLGRMKVRAKDMADSLYGERLRLVRDSYRVDEAITPKLCRLGVMLTKVLRLPLPLDIFVRHEAELNACCFPSRKGNRLVMCLNSGLTTSVTPQELLCIMGHEVGHALLKHVEMPEFSFDGDNLEFSQLEILRLCALERAEEVSCDRFGLLACQDIRVASSALFKIESGLAEKWISFDEAAYARHFDDLSNMSELVDLHFAGWTHPLTSLRVKALIAFGKSETYAKAFGRTGTAITGAEMEQGVDTMLSVLNPDLTGLEDAKVEEAANHFLTDAALMLIAADGVVEPEKLAWLRAHTTHQWSREELTQRMSKPEFHDEMEQELRADAAILVENLSELDRARLFRAACDGAVCGGALPDAEQEVLGRICGLLDIRVEIARARLEESEQEHAQATAAVDNASPLVAAKRRKSTAEDESPEPEPTLRPRGHRSGVTLADLVSNGSVALSDTLAATYKGKSYLATLKKADADVVVVYDGKPYDSVTAAAAAITGKPVNGWAFWTVRSRGGKEKGSLKELRDQLGPNDDEA